METKENLESFKAIPEPNDNEITYGEKVADKVASFGGSWTFIIAFGIFILIWICINIFLLANKGFDPYPFILLNLILSCLASLQAPVIMMSQNRKEQKDRIQSKNDYEVNLQSEREIQLLHEKMEAQILQIKKIEELQVQLQNKIIQQLTNIESKK